MATANPDEIEIEQKFYENVKEYNFDNCLYSLLIVGPCGAGKSAFCNFLLKEERFKEAMGMLAGTEVAAYCTVPSKDGDILVVDCPGFCDPKRSHGDIMKEIGKAAILCRNGMDAIGIVMDPTKRFTETQKISYEQFDTLGGDFWKHAFIIFSREKKLKKTHKSGYEYIQEITKDPKCPVELKNLLAKVDNRYICVESKKQCEYEGYWCEIRDNLLAMIIQIRKDNAGVGYVNALMECGRIVYKAFVDLSNEMAQLMGMQAQMEKQNTHIKDLKKDKAANSHKLDALQKRFRSLIAHYENQITGTTKESESTKSAEDLSSSCSVM